MTAMKFRYIISAIALFGILAITGCADNKVGGDLSNIQVSASYVSIPQNMGEYSSGGSANIKVSATSSWSFKAEEIPSWLTVSPTSGSTGETTVTFTAGKTYNSQSVTLKIYADKNQQYVVVNQPVGDGSAAASTVAEINAGPDGKKFQVTGAFVQLVNDTYGNWYLEDNTGKLYIYGTLDKAGQTKNFKSLGLEVGDVVTVEGPKTTYNGTVELVDVTVVKVVKSLLKLDTTAVAIPKAGGKAFVGATVKGSDLHVDGLPEWLQFLGNDSGMLVFNASENPAGNRSANLSITSGTSTVTLQVNQEGSIIECSIDKWLAAPEDATLYKLTGVITKIDNASYGNIYIKDATGEAYLYGVLLNGEAKSWSKIGAKVGDIITVITNRTSYSGSPQGKNAEYVEHKVVKDITAAEFNALADDADTWYRLTGKVTNGTADPSHKFDLATYGNFDLVDESGDVYVYGLTTGWGGPSKAVAQLGLKADDILTIIAHKGSYKGASQATSAFYVSHTPADDNTPEIEGKAVITDAELPVAYPTEEATFTLGGGKYYLLNVANFGTGIQFKKDGSYLANKDSFGEIKTITITGHASKTFYNGNLKVYAGTSEKPGEVEITSTYTEGNNFATYDLSNGNFTYFKIINASSYAVYLEKIEVEMK